MKKVLVEQIEDGMVLAKEVKGTSGSVLLNRGAVLNAALGRRLKNWGTFVVYVEGEDDTSTGGDGSAGEAPEEIRAKLEEKFSGVSDSPIMKKLLNAFYDSKIKKGNA